MDDLYKRIEKLCEQNKISRYKLCQDTGISQGTLSDLKSGRKKSLNSSTLAKLSNYFQVSVDYLIAGHDMTEFSVEGREGALKNPSAALVSDNSAEEIIAAENALFDNEMIALYGEAKKVLDEHDLEEIKHFIRMKNELKRKRNNEDV